MISGKRPGLVRQKDSLFFLLYLSVAAVLCFFCSCTGSGVSGLPSDPDYTFTVFPVDMENISNVVGFGTHGSNHPEGVSKWYLYCSGTYDVKSPGDGIITEVYPNGEIESRVEISFSKEIYVRFDHIILDPSIKKGSNVSAGQVLGTTGLAALDFNVIDRTADNGLPSSWPREYRRAVCPLGHLSADLQTAFLAEWDSRWLPDLFSPETCEPYYCTNLNINADSDISGVWFTHEPEDETYGVVIVFTRCASVISGGDLRIRMKFKTGSGDFFESYAPAGTDLGGGLTRLQCGGKYFLYQFISPTELRLEISTPAIDTFSANARNYDREWESIWQ